jgi:RimJ/RimL family protein N-acetyltransferase
MVELVRLSGYRLKDEPSEQAVYKWAALRTTVGQYVHLMKDVPTGYYRDDDAKQTPLIDLMMGKLQNGEIYFAFSDKFVGMAAITGIEYGRTGWLEAIAHPDYRNSYATGKATGELILYAFGAYGVKGLGLKKLKAGVAQPNEHTIKLLEKVGFQRVGVLQAETLHGGVPYDMILLELLNPKFFSVDKQVISGTSAKAADIPADPVHVRSPGAVSTDSASGGDSADWGPSEYCNVNGSSLAEPGSIQRVITGPIGRAVRSSADAAGEQLVHAERSAARGGASSEPDGTEWPELR